MAAGSQEMNLPRMFEAGNPEYMTVGLVARWCGVSNTTVLRWIKRGQITAFRLPAGHYRIGKEALAEFLANCHIPSCEFLTGLSGDVFMSTVNRKRRRKGEP